MGWRNPRINGNAIPTESHVFQGSDGHREVDIVVGKSEYGEEFRDVRVNGNLIQGRIEDPVVAAIIFHGLVRVFSEPYFDEVIYQTVNQINDGYMSHTVERWEEEVGAHE